MALSGIFYDNVGSYWRIQGEWTATQNTSANTSTITLKTYWIDRGSSTGVNSSSSKSGSSTIEGTVDSFSATAGLSPNQKKLINTQTRTVSHNSDGTFSGLDLAVSFSVAVTLSGTYYGTVTSSGSYMLNTIPRESTLGSPPTFTAGNNFTVSVNRSSSSFRHEAAIYVLDGGGIYGSPIKTVDLSTSQTSVSSSFSQAEITAIFTKLNGASSRGTRIILKTFNGSTEIGSTTSDGTVTAPAASTVDSSGYDMYQYTDEEIDFNIDRENSNFTHTVKIVLGTYTKTLTGVGSSVSWTPSAGEQTSLNGQFPNTSYKDGEIQIETFYNGVKVRSTTTKLLQFHIRNANPVFTGSISYLDVNSTTTAITSNNQYIIQGQSHLSVTLSSSSATAQKGATMVSYVFSVAGESVTKTYTTSAITHNFLTINAATNQTIVIEAVDSRGLRSTITKIVNVVPYSPPTITASAARINGFEADTILKLTSKESPITVPSGTKNFFTNNRYRTRPVGGAWSGYTSFTGAASSHQFVADDKTVQFLITGAYEVEFNVADRLTTSTITKTVSIGRPIFFIDDILGSIAMNDFPKDPNTFLLNGRLSFAGNMYASSGEGSVGGAIDLNNGDIVRANGIWFNDTAGSAGEGLLFPHASTPANSTNSADYDNFYMRDKKLFMNGNDFIEMLPGTSAGNGILLGSGGLTIIGGGESAKTYANGTFFSAGSEEMIVTSDNDVYIVSNMQGGYAGRREWKFNDDGIIYRPVYKEGNGYNTVTQRTDPSHDSPVLIQESNITVSSGATTGYSDFNFPVAFDSDPEWVITQSNESNSVYFATSPYNVTATGARIYTQRVNGGTSSVIVAVRVISCGKKA